MAKKKKCGTVYHFSGGFQSHPLLVYHDRVGASILRRLSTEYGTLMHGSSLTITFDTKAANSNVNFGEGDSIVQ